MKSMGVLTRLVFALSVLVLVATGCSSSRKTASKKYETIIVKSPPPAYENKNLTAGQKVVLKFATFLKVPPDTLTNVELYTFIDKWLYTPYKYGGTDQKGIDCSAFVQRLLNDVYKIPVPRTSSQQFFTKHVEPFHDAKYFSEGDLLFFATVPGTAISHVGMYLHNRMFINASTSSGVSLANLDDPYWKKRFVAAGRVKH